MSACDVTRESAPMINSSKKREHKLYSSIHSKHDPRHCRRAQKRRPKKSISRIAAPNEPTSVRMLSFSFSLGRNDQPFTCECLEFYRAFFSAVPVRRTRILDSNEGTALEKREEQNEQGKKRNQFRYNERIVRVYTSTHGPNTTTTSEHTMAFNIFSTNYDYDFACGDLKWTLSHHDTLTTVSQVDIVQEWRCRRSRIGS